MHTKYILLFLIFVSGVLGVIRPEKANAYWEIFNVKIPENGDEIYEMLFQSTFTKVVDGIENKTGFELSKVNNVEELNANQDESLVIPESSNITDSEIKPDFVFSETLINDILKNQAQGYKLTDRYVISGVEIDLLDDEFLIKIFFENNLSLEARLKLIEDGKNIEVTDINSVGDKSFSNIELLFIKGFAATIPSQLTKLFPDYTGEIRQISINNDNVEIWLN